MARKDDISLFERFLIMIFGLGVVMAGLYPLTRQYGSVREFVKTKSNSIASLYENFEKKVNRAKLAEPRMPENQKLNVKKSTPVAREGDKLDNKDREELDGLIDNIWK